MSRNIRERGERIRGSDRREVKMEKGERNRKRERGDKKADDTGGA
jgi:hypothetical protein